MFVQKEIKCCDCGNRFLENGDIAFSKLSSCPDCKHKKLLQTIADDKARYG